MSTVLWANVLTGGEVFSDQQDRYALYKHADKLNALTKQLGLPSFEGACDSTDARFNLEDLDLPEGCKSTNDVMAASGAWLARSDALRLLEGLLAHLRENNVRFGLLQNQHGAVVSELEEALGFLQSHPTAEKFNFAVVM
jgi:hypothetical protein